MDRIDYNTVYRNFPGWFYGDDDTVKKAHDAKDIPYLLTLENFSGAGPCPRQEIV